MTEAAIQSGAAKIGSVLQSRRNSADLAAAITNGWSWEAETQQWAPIE
jgi:hypothetical protein